MRRRDIQVTRRPIKSQAETSITLFPVSSSDLSKCSSKRSREEDAKGNRGDGFEIDPTIRVSVRENEKRNRLVWEGRPDLNFPPDALSATLPMGSLYLQASSKVPGNKIHVAFRTEWLGNDCQTIPQSTLEDAFRNGNSHDNAATSL